MIQNEIAALDDKTAIHILQVISKSLMRTGTFEISGTPDMANALQSAFDVSKPVKKASEGDIARLALQLLSDDPKYLPNISALMIGSNTQKFSPDWGTISIVISALVILQTRYKIEKDKKGNISWVVEKKSAADALLKPLIEKLLSYLP
jgi:hypothetical protein